MKKVLLFALSTFAAVSLNAQDCSSGIDNSATEMGFNPNPIVGSNHGTPYDEVITIVIPKDYPTTYQGAPITAQLKKIKIVSISPAQADFFTTQGYAYEIWAKNLGNGNFEEVTVGGTIDTFAIDQTTTNTYACLRMTNPTPPAPVIDPLVDTVHITVEVDALANIGFGADFWASTLQGNIPFVIGFPKRAAGVSVNEIDATKFAIYGTFPNPASSETWVKFSTPTSGDASLKVYDLAGKTVMNAIVPTVAGVNNLQLNVSNLNAGVYLYSLTIGNETVTSKLVVQ